MGPVPDSVWRALRHGDVHAEGIVVRALGAGEIIGYLQPSAALSRELATYAGTAVRPAATIAGDPRLTYLELPVGDGLLPGLSVGADVVEQLLARDALLRSDQDVRWRMLCARARVEAALQENRGDVARDVCEEASRWLVGRHREHLRTMRDAAAVCSLLLANGIDTRQFLQQIREHPRAELLLIAAM